VIGFTDRTAEIEDAIRRDRRPLAVPDPVGLRRHDWVALLAAEVRHATDDFWRTAFLHGASLMFDWYQRDREARPFRFPHEVCAAEAWNWLSDLNMHESDKAGPWSQWQHLSELQRAAWRARWFFLARGFLRHLRNYRSAKVSLNASQRKAA
jgi:hypothetical protein